jgi:Acyl-ACP thioesterase
MGKKMSKEYEIHYYEVDFRKKMTMTRLIDFLGDIATSQTEGLGVGMDYCAAKGIGWILYKWDIKVHKYPMYGEKIIITTEPTAFKRFYGYRKFTVANEQGEIIAEADSIWLLINVEKKRPVRVEADMCAVYGVEEDSEGTIAIEDIVKPEEFNEEKMFNVRYSDIDTNKHVNNSKYVTWAIEVVPMDIVLDYSLNRIKVTYQKETKYGETVRSRVKLNKEADAVICNHAIESGEGNVLALVETYWKKA